VPTTETQLANLPEDNESLKAMLRELLRERDREKQRAEEQRQRADNLYLQNLRLQQQLERFQKWYYGPRADRLQESGDLAQILLEFAQGLESKPIHPEDRAVVPAAAATEPDYELRRVRRRPGRRALDKFENLPVTRRVYELPPEERGCPCCGQTRKEIGEEESWQVEHIPGRFERIQHVRKKYACTQCEAQGEPPRIEVAAKPESAIEKGMAGPGLLAYIVTSKFADYLPLYRLEDIFERQGFEIARGTQSIWCGDVADLVEPLYELMAEQVRQSHVITTDDTIMPMLRPGQTQSARIWVYVGDEAQPYNVFHFTLDRGRDGPKHFLKDYRQVLLADAYGGYNGVVAGNQITRAGCWAHARRKIVDAEKSAPEIAAAAVGLIGALYAVEKEAKGDVGNQAFRTAAAEVGAHPGRVAGQDSGLERATAAQASHGRSLQLHPGAVDGADYILLGRCRAHR
jgi:transposase